MTTLGWNYGWPCCDDRLRTCTFYLATFVLIPLGLVFWRPYSVLALVAHEMHDGLG